MKNKQQSGFSLIELLLVVIIVAIASVPILGQFSHVATSALLDEDIQTASQLAQGHAEEILALRRSQGYAAVNPATSTVGLSGRFSKYSRQVVVSEPSVIGGCASGATCKSVVITVNSASKTRAEVAFVLVDY